MSTFTDRIAKLLPPYQVKLPTANGHQVKAVGSGVQFVGAPDFRQIINLQPGADPQAEKLTRQIAMAMSAYAYTAIMYRATRMAEPPVIVVQDTDEGPVTLPDHDLAMLLDEPSPDFDMGELVTLTEIYRLVTGACLWVKELDVAGRPSTMVPFSGDEFDTEAADGRIYGRFIVRTGAGRRTYTPEEVVFFRDVNPNSWRHGLSRLDVALQNLDLGFQITRTVRTYMRKAMFPGGVISPDKDWNPDDPAWEEWKATIRAWHQGPANAGEPLILQGGTLFTKAAANLTDLLPGEILDRVEATVGSVFGTPPVVLGWKVGLENSPWSQMSEARQMTYEDTIVPRWGDTSKRMTRQMLTPEERAAGLRIQFETRDVRAFQADDAARATTAALMRQEWTRNERRAYTGLDPLPEGDPRGDELGGGTFGEMSLPVGDGEVGISTALSMVIQQGTKALSDPRTFEWASFDMSTKAAESTWAREVHKALADIQREIVKLARESLEDDGKATQDQVQTKEIDPDSVIVFLANLGTYMAEVAGPFLRKVIHPLVVSSGTSAVKRAAAQTGLSFAVLQPHLLDYSEEEADYLASVMCETTAKRVAATVQEELGEGGLIRDIQTALEDPDHTAFSRTRAKLVARTETTRTWNGAQRRSLSGWQQDQAEDVRVFKQWLDSKDQRVRPAHVILGQKDPIPIDDTFEDTDLKEPGEPNCRCTLIYSIPGLSG